MRSSVFLIYSKRQMQLKSNTNRRQPHLKYLHILPPKWKMMLKETVTLTFFVDGINNWRLKPAAKSATKQRVNWLKCIIKKNQMTFPSLWSETTFARVALLDKKKLSVPLEKSRAELSINYLRKKAAFSLSICKILCLFSLDTKKLTT